MESDIHGKLDQVQARRRRTKNARNMQPMYFYCESVCIKPPSSH